MRLISGRMAGLIARSSIRRRIIASLALVGIIAILSASLVLYLNRQDRLERRIDARTDDLVSLLSTTGGDEELDQRVLDSVSDRREYNSIAILYGNSGLIRSSGTGSQSGAGDLLRAISDGIPLSSVQPDDTVVRAMYVGTAAGRDTAAWNLIAIEVDRVAFQNDVDAEFIESLILFSVGLFLILLITYVVLDRNVAGPTRALASEATLLAYDNHIPVPTVVPAGELTTLKANITSLVDTVVQSRDNATVAVPGVPETLPNVWIRFDSSLNVLGSSADSDDHKLSAEQELDVGHLSDLLSSDIVVHVAQLIGSIGPGGESEFHFTAGASLYRALLRFDGRSFILNLQQQDEEMAVIESDTSSAEDLLADLLNDLPVTVLEIDDNGIVLYANRGLFDYDEADDVVGLTIFDISPDSFHGDLQRTLDEVRRTLEPKTVEFGVGSRRDQPRMLMLASAINAVDEFSCLLVWTTLPDAIKASDDSAKISVLEEQLWSVEKLVGEYEQEIEALRLELDRSRVAQSHGSEAFRSLIDDLDQPLSRMLASAQRLKSGGIKNSANDSIVILTEAAMSLGEFFDTRFGTEYVVEELSPEITTTTRFHLATFMDEVAVDGGASDSRSNSRVSAFVQPTLPGWLRGDGKECRATLRTMISFARLVANERSLILAAMQEASEEQLVHVRFEVQIPPPNLSADDIQILRSCIDGEADDQMNRISDSESSRAEIELVTIADDAVLLRHHASFEIGEEPDNEHAWVRGLRTLIIQEASQQVNGLQSTLGALGIIGYVVTSESSLADALRVAEEHSNPYRLVLADADTPALETFLDRLIGGSAPVVLVGPRKLANANGALPDGYSGYLTTPVRQTDLLETILRTIEPPDSSDAA